MPDGSIRIGVLVSGGGSNLGAILKAQRSQELGQGRVVLVVSNKPDAYALERAADHGVERLVILRRDHASDESYDQALIKSLDEHHVQLVVLAGFLRKLGPQVIGKYRGRILNIHPALLPKYGGAGMYGHFVHEAVLAAKEKESGCTVHLVDEEFDHGPVIAQAKVPVMAGDHPEDLARRVLEQEHLLYPATIADFCNRLSGVQGSIS